MTSHERPSSSQDTSSVSDNYYDDKSYHMMSIDTQMPTDV